MMDGLDILPNIGYGARGFEKRLEVEVTSVANHDASDKNSVLGVCDSNG